jgi:predicted CoA-binding protein
VIAVVGLSPSWNRPSYFAAKYMLEHGYTVIPVNPGASEILGQKCYPELASIPVKVDMVDVFRKAEDAGPIADEAIRIGARCLWLQLGVINREAAERAAAAGLDVVMDRCVKIEYARLFGGLNYAGVNTRVISAKRPPCPARLCKDDRLAPLVLGRCPSSTLCSCNWKRSGRRSASIHCASCAGSSCPCTGENRTGQRSKSRRWRHAATAQS